MLLGNRMSKLISSSSNERWESDLKTAIGAGPSTQRLIEAIRLLAPLCHHVLIVGETGCGHREVAKALIKAGGRYDESPSVYRCGDSPEPIEAFLGRCHRASSFKAGNCHEENEDVDSKRHPARVIQIEKLESLDRLGQHQLLQWIESQSSKTGDPISLDCDHRDPGEEVEALRSRPQLLLLSSSEIDSRVRDRSFDPELFYAIHAMRLDLVPLRERKKEIPELVHAFQERSSKRFGRESPKMTPDAVRALAEYAWPGNLLELQSVMDRIVALFDSPTLHRNELLALMETRTSEAMVAAGEDFDSLVKILVRLGLQRAPIDATDLQEQIVGQVEKELIAQVLSSCDQIQTKAAIRLGMNRNTLHKKMKDSGLDEAIESGSNNE